MHFDAGVPAVSPIEEWMARVSPVLYADNPHQECIRRAYAENVADVNLVCSCEHATTCDKECCR